MQAEAHLQGHVAIVHAAIRVGIAPKDPDPSAARGGRDSSVHRGARHVGRIERPGACRTRVEVAARCLGRHHDGRGARRRGEDGASGRVEDRRLPRRARSARRETRGVGDLEAVFHRRDDRRVRACVGTRVRGGEANPADADVPRAARTAARAAVQRVRLQVAAGAGAAGHPGCAARAERAGGACSAHVAACATVCAVALHVATRPRAVRQPASARRSARGEVAELPCRACVTARAAVAGIEREVDTDRAARGGEPRADQLARTAPALVAGGGAATIAAGTAVRIVARRVDAARAAHRRSRGADGAARAGVADLRGCASDAAPPAVVAIRLRVDARAAAGRPSGRAFACPVPARLPRRARVAAPAAVARIGACVHAPTVAQRLARRALAPHAAGGVVDAARPSGADAAASAAVRVVGPRVHTRAATGREAHGADRLTAACRAHLSRRACIAACTTVRAVARDGRAASRADGLPVDALEDTAASVAVLSRRARIAAATAVARIAREVDADATAEAGRLARGRPPAATRDAGRTDVARVTARTAVVAVGREVVTRVRTGGETRLARPRARAAETHETGRARVAARATVVRVDVRVHARAAARRLTLRAHARRRNDARSARAHPAGRARVTAEPAIAGVVRGVGTRVDAAGRETRGTRDRARSVAAHLTDITCVAARPAVRRVDLRVDTVSAAEGFALGADTHAQPADARRPARACMAARATVRVFDARVAAVAAAQGLARRAPSCPGVEGEAAAAAADFRHAACVAARPAVGVVGRDACASASAHRLPVDAREPARAEHACLPHGARVTARAAVRAIRERVRARAAADREVCRARGGAPAGQAAHAAARRCRARVAARATVGTIGHEPGAAFAAGGLTDRTRPGDVFPHAHARVLADPVVGRRGVRVRRGHVRIGRRRVRVHRRGRIRADEISDLGRRARAETKTEDHDDEARRQPIPLAFFHDFNSPAARPSRRGL